MFSFNEADILPLGNKPAPRLFLLGAGAMAEAFIRGIVRKGALQPEQIYVLNRSRGQRLMELQEEYGVVPAKSLMDAADAAVVVLAVKPADAAQALDELRPYLHGQLLISFAAGLSTEWLLEAIGNQAAVVRTMPNLPVAVESGVTAVAFAEHVTHKDRLLARFLLEQVGAVVEMEESLLDAATAFSGSGPGFVCYFLEAMEESARRLGFDEETARALLLHTVAGTAKVLLDWQLSPEILRRRVTSPRGTTHAGLQVFEQSGLKTFVNEALQAAAARSAEMGKQFKTKDRSKD